MPSLLAIAVEAVKAPFPLCGQDIPDKPERVEPRTAVGQHGVLSLALHADPLS